MSWNETYSNGSGFTFITGGGSPTFPKIGMNLSAAADYESGRTFADAFKSSRPFYDSTNSTALTSGQVDANGWPTQDSSVVVVNGLPNVYGDYALSFNGSATVVPGFSTGSTVIGQSYNSTSNVTTAVIRIIDTGSAGLILTFTGTKRTNASATNTGITNIKLMRPIAPGSTTSYTTELFTSQFIASLAMFSTLRAMDFLSTNNLMIVNWADRTLPSVASQAVGNISTSFAFGGQGRGASWEYLVLLANLTGKDIWINIPVIANDDYTTKVAQLFKYGSDGVNPYTSVQSSPVFPPLNAGINVYVEYCNELWNGSFTHSGTNTSLAISEVGAGSSPLNFDGDTNSYIWAWRRPAKRIVEISNIFRTVWGDAAMNTTIRPVLMSQIGYATGPSLQEAHLLLRYYANPNMVGTPHLPKYYLYGQGGSAYYLPTDKTTVNGIFSTLGSTFNTDLGYDANYSLSLGLKRIAYEGGPSLDTTGNTTNDANQLAAWSDARMTTAVQTQQATWDQNAGDLLVYFTLASSLTGYYQWAFMQDVLSPTSAKMTAITNILAAPKGVSTYGTAIPATIAGTAATAPPTFGGGTTNFTSYLWLGFPVKVASAGTFSITLTASATATGVAEIIVDGVSLGTVSVVTGGPSSALVTASLPTGSHGIVVRCVSGTFTLTNLIVS